MLLRKTRWRVDLGVLFGSVVVVVGRNFTIIVPEQNFRPVTGNSLRHISRM